MMKIVFLSFQFFFCHDAHFNLNLFEIKLNRPDIFKSVVTWCFLRVDLLWNFWQKIPTLSLLKYLRLEQIQHRLDENLIIVFAHAISIFHNHEVR